jgi:hypothetical protein
MKATTDIGCRGLCLFRTDNPQNPPLIEKTMTFIREWREFGLDFDDEDRKALEDRGYLEKPKTDLQLAFWKARERAREHDEIDDFDGPSFD